MTHAGGIRGRRRRWTVSESCCYETTYNWFLAIPRVIPHLVRFAKRLPKDGTNLGAKSGVCLRKLSKSCRRTKSEQRKRSLGMPPSKREQCPRSHVNPIDKSR